MDLTQTVKLTFDGAVRDLAHLGFAYVLAVPIGWNREHEVHTAGIRTFPIVAMASCALALVAQSVPGASSDSFSRVLQGLVTGIGFVGGGAIVKDKGAIGGTATAASIWCIGIAGAAVGVGAYHIAIALSVVSYFTLKLLAPVKRELSGPEPREKPES